MKYEETITLILLSLSIVCSNLYAQYDNGTAVYYAGGYNITAVSKNYIVEDFDGDFNADVILVKSNASNNSAYLTWHKGDGSGSFTVQPAIMGINIAHYENEIFYADMNEDGNSDIVFQNSNTGFTILLNDGFGNIIDQIDNEVIIGNPFGADLKELADVDGDGDMDCIFWNKVYSTSNGGYSGYCLIGYNNGTGIFSNSNYAYLDNDNLGMYLLIESGDLDGDGNTDLVCSGVNYNGQSIDIFVRLYKNTGSNNSPVVQEIILPDNTYSANVKIKNIDSNGNDELLLELGTYEVYYHSGGTYPAGQQFKVLNYDTQTTTFATLEEYNSLLHNYTPFILYSNFHKLYDNTFHIQFGHQNTDGNIDILSANASQGVLRWYMGDGNGDFNNTQVVNLPNQYSSSIRPVLRVADIDNDADLDVFLLVNSYNASILKVFKNLALSPVCEPVLDLESSVLTDGIYQAGTTTISHGNIVAGNNNVVLKAGNNVKLQSGFKAPSNSTVKIRISSCN